jgi:hypothetical protein
MVHSPQKSRQASILDLVGKVPVVVFGAGCLARCWMPISSLLLRASSGLEPTAVKPWTYHYGLNR